jgi:hypothetical protein
MYIYTILDYVEDIYKRMVNAGKTSLASAYKELIEMTPKAMNTMLQKQSREEAVAK